MIRNAKTHLEYEHGLGIEGINTGDIAGKPATLTHREKVVLRSERKEITVPHEVWRRMSAVARRPPES
jgi:hypothetical protein